MMPMTIAAIRRLMADRIAATLVALAYLFQTKKVTLVQRHTELDPIYKFSV